MELFNNYDVEAYLEAAREELEEDECNEARAYEIAQELMQIDYDELDYQLTKYFNTHTCIAYGTIGRWDRALKGFNIIENIKDYYNLVKDCEYLKLTLDDALNVQGCHHDGTNYITIRELTNDGINYYDDYEYDGDLDKLFNNLLKLSITPTLEF